VRQTDSGLLGHQYQNSVSERRLAWIRLPACRSWLGRGYRHHPDLLREGDEARVVLVGTQEGTLRQLDHAAVVCCPGVLQPFEHLLRLLPKSIDLGDLATGVVGLRALNHVHLRLIDHGINNEKLLFPFAF
jgi:hypothetical protein